LISSFSNIGIDNDLSLEIISAKEFNFISNSSFLLIIASIEFFILSDKLISFSKLSLLAIKSSTDFKLCLLRRLFNSFIFFSRTDNSFGLISNLSILIFNSSNTSSWH